MRAAGREGRNGGPYSTHKDRDLDKLEGEAYPAYCICSCMACIIFSTIIDYSFAAYKAIIFSLMVS